MLEDSVEVDCCVEIEGSVEIEDFEDLVTTLFILLNASALVLLTPGLK